MLYYIHFYKICDYQRNINSFASIYDLLYKLYIYLIACGLYLLERVRRLKMDFQNAISQ
jgi:hypothetical protein